MEQFQELSNKFTSSEYSLYWALAGLLILLAFYTAFKCWMGCSRQRKIIRILRKAGNDILNDATMSDGMDGYVHIDYLMLTPYGIIVIDLKDYPGLIFGGEITDQWTQVLGRKSYKFENPLYQNQNRVATIKSLIPGVSVTGWVVFTDTGNFPKGMPDNVYMLNTLLADVGKANKKDEIPQLAKLGWKKIKDIIEDYKKSRVR